MVGLMELQPWLGPTESVSLLLVHNNCGPRRVRKRKRKPRVSELGSRQDCRSSDYVPVGHCICRVGVQRFECEGLFCERCCRASEDLHDPFVEIGAVKLPRDPRSVRYAVIGEGVEVAGEKVSDLLVSFHGVRSTRPLDGIFSSRLATSIKPSRQAQLAIDYSSTNAVGNSISACCSIEVAGDCRING